MEQRPNIMLIILSDVGDWLGCYDSGFRSPVLDRFASQAAVFDRHFCTAPQCSPSRASMMTGRLPHNNGVMGLTHRGYDMNRDERPLPQLLRDAGYHTCLIGTQHETRDSAWEGYEEVRGDSNRVGYVVDETIAFLRDYPGDAPFFLCLGIMDVHRPYPEAYDPDTALSLDVPPWLPDVEPVRLDLATLHHYIEETDARMEGLFTTLETTGLADKTMVIFTTDHGVPVPRAKTTLYDPGLKIAMMMRWPGAIPAGERIDALTTNMDLMPTLCDLVRVDMPARVQGQSFAGLLTGRDYRPRGEILAEITWHGGVYYGKRCIRTGSHKLILNFEPRRGTGANWQARERLGDLFDHYFGAVPPPVEFYDLTADPYEQNNLAGDAASDRVRNDLQQRLVTWLKATRDPILDGPVPHANPEYSIGSAGER